MNSIKKETKRIIFQNNTKTLDEPHRIITEYLQPFTEFLYKVLLQSTIKEICIVILQDNTRRKY
jgi:hypothetical protein